jgi:MFS transporter, putative metabolite transport protein
VQDHIDELPMWVDGTLLSAPPMTRMQWRIWSLAAAGKFFTGFILFMTGVAHGLLGQHCCPISTECLSSPAYSQ